MPRVKRFLFTTAFFSIFCSLQGISAELKPVRIGSSPTLSSAGIFIAQERGYFREFGLDAKITVFNSSSAPMTALLAKGDLDVGGGNITAGLWNAREQGLNLKIVADKGHVAPGRSYIALLVRKDHLSSGRYMKLKDLKGFKLALTAIGGVSQEIATDRFLKAGGLTLADVTLIKMSYAEMNLALKTRMIDATVQLEPYLSEAVLDGFAVNVAPLTDVYPDQPSAGIFYSPSFSKSEFAAKFMAAYLKGVRDYEKSVRNPELRGPVQEILQKYTPSLPEKVWEKMIPVGLNPNGQINRQALMGDAKWYQSKGYIPPGANLDAIFDDSSVEAALKLIGEYKSK